jgi:DNA-binding winged helix-turn-helix (wHTH) protein
MSQFVFGLFEIDPALYELRRAGQPVPVQPKVFDMLAYLIEHRDRVVTKDELRKRLWPGEFVSEAALSFCIKEARKAVGDDGHGQQIIKTFQRRGYRFVARVEQGPSGRATPELSSQPESSIATQPPSVPRQIFVGRHGEMKLLALAVDSANAGSGRAVMLAGDPGIGKTRTAQEVALLAESRGAHVLWGRCHEGEGAPAFWPWLQIIRTYVLQRDPESLRAEMGSGAPEVVLIVHDAQVAGLLGYVDRALRRVREALQVARRIGHPLSEAEALLGEALILQRRRDAQRTREVAEKLVALAGQQGFALFRAAGTILQGWAMVQLGQRQPGIALMQRGTEAYVATGAALGPPGFRAWLAEAYGLDGRPVEGLQVLAHALLQGEQTGLRYIEPELHRLKGELLLQEGIRSKLWEGEQCFVLAREIARRQGAKWWELRATTCLSRLWYEQRRINEARQLLRGVYKWFTEGFETEDLRAARSLLGALG